MEMVVANNSGRIRVVFEDDGILTKTQSKQGLKRSWVLLKPQYTTIADVINHLIHSFQLHLTCPRGIFLSVDGFVLPPFESTSILKDTDLICVKKRTSKLQGLTNSIEAGKTSIKDAIHQPLPSGVMLLTNKEHDEETESSQSDTDVDDEAEKTILPQENGSGQDVNSKKRKASSEIKTLKKSKKQRQQIPKSGQKKHGNSRESTPQKKSKVENRNEGESTLIKSTEKLKSTISESKKEPNERQEEKTTPVSQTCDGTKKVSRSSKRKRLQRRWQKLQREKQKMEKSEEQQSSKAVDEESDGGGELVPVEVRPGYIRFTPSDKVKDVQQKEATSGGDVHTTDNSTWQNHSVKSNGWKAQADNTSKDTFGWNGISTKRKGQKWGKQKQSSTSWKDDNTPSQQYGWKGKKWNEDKQPPSWKKSSNTNGWGPEKQSSEASRKQGSSEAALDYEKLVPLTDLPKEGDVFAYRLLELSSSWCPELSSFRIGKVARFEQEANTIVLVQDPKYPLNIEKKTDDDDDDDDDGIGKPPASSMYDEDGTLEIDFTSLVDVRVVKRSDTFQVSTSQTPAVNGTAVTSETAKEVNETQFSDGNVASAVGNGELETPTPTPTPTPVCDKKDAWEEISEALSAKKAQLTQDDQWKKKEKSTNRSWSNRTLRGSALGPTMAMLRAQNGLST